MKQIFAIAILFSVAFVASADLKCSIDMPSVPTEWLDMFKTCIEAMRGQIQKEVDASMAYLSMGAYFSRDTVNRPGFAKHFFEAASEERDHANKLIEYLLMRGGLSTFNETSLFADLIKVKLVETTKWTGVEALKEALKLEASVTDSIKGVIKVCESDKNDYHLVDYLTGEFLEEQYNGQRELAGMISTLSKMTSTHGTIGEFLFDKTLL